MNTRVTGLVLLAFAVAVLTALHANAQIYGSRVVDKAFEENDIFFQPALINPFGLSGFGDAASGFIQHPLLDLEINPALATVTGSGSWSGYLDFRRSAPSQEEVYPVYGCPYCLDAAALRIPYPYYGGYTHEAARPLLAAALFGKPVAGRQSVVLGASYQLVFRDSDYYAVPYDIYRSAAALDFQGNRVAEVGVPSVDGSSGENSLRTTGHLLNLHVAATAGPLAAGGRVGFVRHAVDGSMGHQDAWTNPAQSPDRSFWSDLEERRQEYAHVDIEFGIQYHVSDNMSAGVSVGTLFGNAEQALVRGDTSFYAASAAPPDVYSNEYLRGGNTLQDWDRDGTQTWGGADLRYNAGSNATVYAVYRGAMLGTDLNTVSSIRDSTFADYAGGTYTSSSSSTLIDERVGSGDRSGSSHRIATGIQWSFAERSRISFGVDVNTRLRETDVQERVSTFQHSRNEWSNTGGSSSWRYVLVSDQELTWSLRSRRTDVTIPVYLTTRVSDYVLVEFGLSRRFSLLNLSDETIVRHIATVEEQNGQTIVRDGMTEYYREPRIRESDVSTSFLAGFTVTPAPGLDVRFLLSPVQQTRFGQTDIDWRWWIGFELSSR